MVAIVLGVTFGLPKHESGDVVVGKGTPSPVTTDFVATTPRSVREATTSTMASRTPLPSDVVVKTTNSAIPRTSEI